MIRLVKEDPRLYGEFGVYECCIFCGSKTKTWHKKSNTPVCPPCSILHKTGEIPEQKKKSYDEYLKTHTR